MYDPNFSESQLQQAVNSAYQRKLYELSGNWFFANVPSLFHEFDLGWDSAFYLPWLKNPPAIDHEGCNFFIQYKISGQLASAGAKEWPFWNTEYFRFKIPHSTRDKSGRLIDDYHQWKRLKELANLKYPTFYATNSTLDKEILISEFSDGTLLNTIPLLDVRKVSGLHKYVTFTENSNYFFVHSEITEVNKTLFIEAIKQISDLPSESLEESNENLLRKLGEIREENENWRDDLSRILMLKKESFQEIYKPWIIRTLISNFIYKYIGANIFWMPLLNNDKHSLNENRSS